MHDYAQHKKLHGFLHVPTDSGKITGIPVTTYIRKNYVDFCDYIHAAETIAWNPLTTYSLKKLHEFR